MMTGRILQLGKFHPIRGGVEKVMYDLTLGLSERGVPCDMLCAEAEPSTGGEAASAAARQRGIPSETSVTPASGLFGTTEIWLNQRARIFRAKTWFKAYSTMVSPAMVWKLWRMRKDYSLIHIHHPDPMAALALLLSGHKGPVVLHWHSDIEKQKLLLRLYKPLQDWLLRRADLIVGTTSVYLEESPFLKGFQDKTLAVPIGIDEVSPDPEAVARVRDKYPGKKLVFSLGRLVGYKGYSVLVQAAKHLPDDCLVLIGGSGPLKEDLQRQVDREGLDGKVKLLGRIPDEELPAFYGACDLFCLSSILKTEAFAIVQVEAMSCGKPIVATQIPGSGVPWVNKSGESGLNVPPRDPVALARAIGAMLSDDKLRASLSAGARRRYEELFRKETMVDRVVLAYKEVLKRKKNDCE